jgi:hypothetical protein
MLIAPVSSFFAPSETFLGNLLMGKIHPMIAAVDEGAAERGEP